MFDPSMKVVARRWSTELIEPGKVPLPNAGQLRAEEGRIGVAAVGAPGRACLDTSLTAVSASRVAPFVERSASRALLLVLDFAARLAAPARQGLGLGRQEVG